MAERAAVNRRVEGSIPSGGAITNKGAKGFDGIMAAQTQAE